MMDDLGRVLNPGRHTGPSAMSFHHIVGIHEGRQPELVHLRFDPEGQARLLKEQWHPSERIEPRPDGDVDYFVEIAPCWQIKRWIFGFGGNVEVIAPPDLEQLVIDSYRRIVERNRERNARN